MQTLQFLIVYSFFIMFVIKNCSTGSKSKGQQIIMSGGGLILKENKKKKGDTIVISDGKSCGCGGHKTKMVPIPIMVSQPKKEVKVVHVPHKEVKVVHVPVHHHHDHGDSWGGSGMLHEESYHGGWVARADGDDGMYPERMVRTLDIGDKYAHDEAEGPPLEDISQNHYLPMPNLTPYDIDSTDY